jgi:anti-sigma-K factor RskA
MDERPDRSDEINDLLVAYALDALEPAEHERVRRLLSERPELQATLDELRATVGRLPYGLAPAAPPPELRQRVLDHAVGRTARTAPAEARAGGPAATIRTWLFGLGVLAAALLVALITTLGQISGLQSELAVARQQRDQAQLIAATAQTAAQQFAAVVAQPVALAELSGAGGRGTVVQSADGNLILAADLPPLAGGRVYQLWLIEGQNAPISGGVFTVGTDGYGLLTLEAARPISGATLAVTNEPAPGSPGPTSDILIVGQASG